MGIFVWQHLDSTGAMMRLLNSHCFCSFINVFALECVMPIIATRLQTKDKMGDYVVIRFTEENDYELTFEFLRGALVCN